MEAQQNKGVSTDSSHNQQWLNHIHPAPVKKTSPTYDLRNMQPFEIIRGCDDGTLDPHDKDVYHKFVALCKAHHEGPLKELFRKEALRLFSHFIAKA